MQAGLGSLLKIKPLLRIHAGGIEVEKPRTMGKAVDRMVGLVAGLGHLERLSMVHTELLDSLRRLVAPLALADAPLPTIEASPAIGVHLGPAAMAVKLSGIIPGF